MSRPRYWWYGNVVRMIRCYPSLELAKADEQMPVIVANYSGMPRSGGVNRITEQCAARGLSRQEEDIIAAVRSAIEEFEARPDGKDVLAVVKLYQWGHVRDFDYIAFKLNMGRNTAKRSNSKFVYAVARNLGYLKDGLTEPKNNDTMAL